MENRKLVLITGATGFIGSHLVKALSEEGYRCRCLIRQTSRIDQLKNLKNVEFVFADDYNIESLKVALKDIVIVFHLAAQIGDFGISYSQFYKINVVYTANLLEAVYLSKVRHFIFCSTPGVQGKGFAQAIEEFPYNPPYDYEITKMEAEKIVLDYHRKRKELATTIIRPDFVYGPNDKRRIVLYKAIRDRKFFIIGKGKNWIHPTYIDDAINGFLLAADNPIAFGEVYNIAGPSPITIKEYVETIAKILGVSLPWITIPKNIALIGIFLLEIFYKISGNIPLLTRSKLEFLTQDHGSDITKAQAHFDYKAKVDLDEGMLKTINWCKEQNLI